MKIKNNIIKFINFFVISYFIWFFVDPKLALTNVLLILFLSIVASVLFYVVIENASYRYFYNFMVIFTKMNFYEYIAFMFKEVITSSYEVVKLGLSFHNSYHSEIIDVQLPEKTPVYKCLLVLVSIVLTPGTTVVKVDGKKFKVHCLTKSAHNGMQEGKFIEKILSFNF